MPVTIENKTDTRVLLRLNSGRSWHLGPHGTLEVESVEIKGNASVARLEERGQIAVRAATAGTEAPGENGEAEPRARRGRTKQTAE